MDFKDISLPEAYKESSDFRFFLKWFTEALGKIKYDTENLSDIYDPLRCPSNLLWALADTIGYKYDDRLPTSFNRLVLVYFMSMIRNKGSKNGVTLAAETNLAQFNLLMQANGYTDENDIVHPGKKILHERLEDVSIPVNSVYVTAHTDKGYIDIVYFSTKIPKDACIEYVRPLGMYCFQNAGVRFDSRTKVSVDARLTNINDVNDRNNHKMTFGPTQVAHYTRADYASLQKTISENLVANSKFDLSNWTKNFDFPITNIYDANTYENILTYKTITHYERFYVKQSVTPDTDYVLSFDFCSPSGFSWGGYEMGVKDACLFITSGSDEQLSKLSSNAKGFRNPGLGLIILGRSEMFNTQATDTYTKYEIKFNSEDNTDIYICLDFGYVLDGTTTTYKFKDLKLLPESYGNAPANDAAHTRREVYQSNKDNEVNTDSMLNPAYRAVYSLQLSNNEQIVKSLIDPIFSLGYGTMDITTEYVDDYLKYPYEDHYSDGTIIKDKAWNLRYDKNLEESITPNVYTVDSLQTNKSPLNWAWGNLLDSTPIKLTLGSFGYVTSQLDDENRCYFLDGELHLNLRLTMNTPVTSDYKVPQFVKIVAKYITTNLPDTINYNVETDFDLNDLDKNTIESKLSGGPQLRWWNYTIKVDENDLDKLPSSFSINLGTDVYYKQTENDDYELITSAKYTGYARIDLDESQNSFTLRPRVNPPMIALGDSISMNSMNTEYTDINANGVIKVVPSSQKK